MTTYFNPNITVESKAKSVSIIPIKAGQFLMTTDTRSIFYDLEDSRIQLTDILELDTEVERQALIAPVNKFYFIKDTGALYLDKFHLHLYNENDKSHLYVEIHHPLGYGLYYQHVFDQP